MQRVRVRGHSYILQELSEGLSDPLFQKDQGLAVGAALHRLQQGLGDGAVAQGPAGGAVGVAGGEGGDARSALHADATEWGRKA